MSWAPHLSVPEFQQLQRLFNEVAGLRFDATALVLFQRRLGPRLPVHELTSFRDYARVLSESHEELGAALELLTSGETYFFRHEEQLDLLAGKILPAIAAANAAVRRLIVWSAGCSSGEEAYTAAILVQESGLFQGWDVRILGSDLSPERIEHARQGCYFQGAFRSTDESLRSRYFVQSGRFWQVCEQTRQLCQFVTGNLLDTYFDPLIGRADVILCRNVLIYLDDAARARVLRNLYDRLASGGFLLLGHSESLKFLDVTLEFQSLQQDLAFRKPQRNRRGGEP
ncbi:MAG TPA: protein-glutamate O-methyltransferase CheR [Polyangiaceae bacterium]|nr:protein-glutamate O-methyltransferase CheR [Polyangiaceae bacterium]